MCCWAEKRELSETVIRIPREQNERDIKKAKTRRRRIGAGPRTDLAGDDPETDRSL